MPHFFQDQQQQQLSSLPPELVYEIIYNTITTPKNLTTNTSSQNRTTFPTRINTLTNLSLTTHSLRNLILSSPLLWSSEIEINIVNDVSCSPPLSFLKQLFERSANVKMSVRLIHWGEEYLDFNTDKRVEWCPGVTRQLCQLLEDNEGNIEKLYLEFHQLNGTEYTSQPGILETKWKSLKHVEMYSSNWSLTCSIPMDWVESVLETACPEIVVIKGSGIFGWRVLGGDGMSCLRKLVIETEIEEGLAIGIIAWTPNLEECSFKRLVQVSRTSTRTAGLASETIQLKDLKKLRVGSLRGIGLALLNTLETPALLELELDFAVETNLMMGWDSEVFGGFIRRSRLNSSLRRLAIRRGVIPQRKLEECMAMFSSDMTAEWLS